MSLDAPEQAAIDAFGDPSRPEHATLEEWAESRGVTMRDHSEAAVLRALLQAGAEALRAKALEHGYEKLAAARDADRHERRARRDRALERHE